jgi:hypothetical protein
MTAPDDRFRQAEGDLTGLAPHPEDEARLDAEYACWSRSAGAALLVVVLLGALVASGLIDAARAPVHP